MDPSGPMGEESELVMLPPPLATTVQVPFSKALNLHLLSGQREQTGHTGQLPSVNFKARRCGKTVCVPSRLSLGKYRLKNCYDSRQNVYIACWGKKKLFNFTALE